MTREDIVTEEGIDARFMSWLWNKDRQKYTLITLGHLELITEQLVREFVDAREPKGLTAKVVIVGKPSLLTHIPIGEKGTE